MGRERCYLLDHGAGNEEGLTQRVVVIGCSGSGKSTLARIIGDTLELPVYHLDSLYWQPGSFRPMEVFDELRSCGLRPNANKTAFEVVLYVSENLRQVISSVVPNIAVKLRIELLRNEMTCQRPFSVTGP